MEEGMQSYAASVLADSSGVYCSNALRFATEAEAAGYGSDLAWRWRAVRDVKVIETPEPINTAWVGGKTTQINREAQAS